MIEIRTPSEDDFTAIFRRDEEAFGSTFSDEQRTTWRGLLDLQRFRAAFDGGALVGFAGTHALEITLPGGAVVPMAGTTWVSVAPTHRRQGVLRQLMDAVHVDVDDRNEPVAGLLASEGGIYERFGYGVATRRRHVELDRRLVQLEDRCRPEPGGLELIDPLGAVDRLAEIYDRYRRGRVGELSRTAEWIGMRLREGAGRRSGAIHRDGYAIWTITEDWDDFLPRHELRLHDLVACSDEAHTALWHLVLSHDLVGPVRSGLALTVDDRLPGLLTNPRAVRTIALHDFLWLCPRRVGELLARRRYRIADSLVVDVDGERWRVDGAPDGAEASVTSDAADVEMTRAAMGTLLLGGSTATELAATGRLFAADLPRADVFFGWAPVAHCTTEF